MPSLQHRLVVLALRLIRRKRIWASIPNLHASLAEVRQSGPERPSERLQREFEVRHEWLDGQELYTLAPRAPMAGAKHLLYLHGGAYVRPISRYHWGLLADLVRRSGCTISVPFYPLAPEHTCQQALAFAHKAWALARERAGSQPLLLGGDSAGGALALALAFALRERNEALPEWLLLICPWADVRMTNPACAAIEPRDPMLALAGTREAGRLYAGELSLEHPSVSPLEGEFSGLPPLLLVVGTRDTACPDALLLADRARAQGVTVDLVRGDGLVHVWPLFPIPEADAVRERMACLLR
ncbi:alpha/beta hydrolase [Pseudomonas sp. LS44]|uniref:alpha/beta hydrolase fold domain-containing protein n=1 Tax=Pseudomonas sp. LS44 TaxID=1357074 RepID=UPI00215A5C5E|nr:alpha/beta hydrolase [Pseudomonas sp. LS44]UVE17257.1 alpha/beta hydrolase [Pseudomonas sp. LS44]